MSKTIEIFTDSSRFSNELELQIKHIACSRCTVIIYDASHPDSQEMMETKAAKYGVTVLPAVTLDGHVIPLDQLNKESIPTLVQKLLQKEN
ncbi:hypothetical protein [Alkalihalobacillus sp. LMS39]|uniref:hypothetical protein n=1 Tax=Alkalihalobacillus sp. LMS39 TaxID=2924032 RepID=UPI001FB20774|nr:hypothetical protein [Alkalihalobacillus sp. LMS39]UOE94077.1 hypothetical protein MM271_23365 [Alkalihalobacillus sp. LMS39]